MKYEERGEVRRRELGKKEGMGAKKEGWSGRIAGRPCEGVKG